MTQPAILALEDGSVFKGISIGATGTALGELVFNTAMSGYQEILTDPSYANKLVTFTTTHLGNVGINSEDAESNRIQAAGLVIRDLAPIASNFRSTSSLTDYLTAQGLVAISAIDTRRLTRLLRDKGSLKACILAGDLAKTPAAEQQALEAATTAPGLSGQNLTSQVSCQQAYTWTEGLWRLGQGFAQLQPQEQQPLVVVYDFGVKTSFLRQLVSRGCRVQVVPATTPAAEALALQPKGVFLSNGPGDPAACTQLIATLQELLAAQLPLFGLGLGYQLLGLALGAKSSKLAYGHHGANHPVKNLHTGKVMITSQHHSFALEESSLPAQLEATHKSLFDNSLQGFKLHDRPVFGFQGHPTSSNETQSAANLFDQFVATLNEGVALNN